MAESIILKQKVLKKHTWEDVTGVRKIRDTVKKLWPGLKSDSSNFSIRTMGTNIYKMEGDRVYRQKSIVDVVSVTITIGDTVTDGNTFYKVASIKSGGKKVVVRNLYDESPTTFSLRVDGSYRKVGTNIKDQILKPA